ncbi:hypothetical protein EV401DRAFT_1038852 [Pisolithus croceorrhizus]|nr:hypothetical protein EV401DRAFT_1038852 [Pisolithus croceorrhizus]
MRMRRWRMLLPKERSLRTSRRTSFLFILITNHDHPTSVCLWTNRVEVPQGYCNKKDVRTTRPRAVANRVDLIGEFYSGGKKVMDRSFLPIPSFIFSEAPRRSFLDLPAKSATTAGGGKSISLASELLLTGTKQPRKSYLLTLCVVIRGLPFTSLRKSSNSFFPIWRHPLFTSFRCRKPPSFENQVLSDMSDTLPAY